MHAGQAAAVLPDLSAVDFDERRFRHYPIAELKSRALVLIANPRSLDRAGLSNDSAAKLASLLKQDFSSGRNS